MFCGLAITFTTLAQQVTAANITLVASDATHSPFDSFAYPRLTSHSDSSPLVAVKPSVVTTNPQQTGVAIGSGDPLHWAVKTGGFTPAPFARGYFDSIGDYDTGGSGVVAFVGNLLSMLVGLTRRFIVWLSDSLSAFLTGSLTR